jgi:DNA-binding CsgD family transcriptional regulator
VSGWPLIGRGPELALVEGELEQGGANGVLFTGPPGVGKTRMADEVVGLARSREIPVAAVRCTESGRSVPLGAFMSLLPTRMAKQRLPEESVDALRWAHDHLVADHDRLVVLVDDAQHLDNSSAVLVHQLALDPCAFLVLTVRSGQTRAPDAITSLWKDEVVARIDLAPLTKEQVAELLAAVLGGPVTGAALQAVWEKTLGNPLFLRELLAATLASGALIQRGAIWDLAGPLEVGGRVGELAEYRMAGLDDPARAVIEMIAVGGSLPLEIVTERFPADAIQRAEESGFLRIEDSVAMMDHPVYGDVVRAGLGAMRTAAVKGEVADAMASAPATTVDPVLRATLAVDAGATIPPDLLVDATNLAFERGDLVLAERLSRAAVDAGGGARPQLLLADALRRQERGPESIAVLEQIEPNDDAQRADVAMLMLMNQLWCLGDVEAGRAAMLQAAQMPDPDGRLRVAAAWASFQNFMGDPRQALTIVRPCLDEPRIAPFALLGLFSALGPALAFSGQADEAMAVAARAFEPGLQEFDEIPAAASWAGATMLLTQWLCGFLTEARAMATGAYEGSLGFGQEAARAFTAATLGCIALETGHASDAFDWFVEGRAASAHPGADIQGAGVISRAGMARVLAQRGDLDGARAVLPHASAIGVHQGWTRPYVEITSAWIAAGAGDLSGARVELQRSADRATESGMACFEVMALLDLARVDGAAEAAPRLRELSETVEGPRADLAARYATALAAADAALLDELSVAFEACGMCVLAAEAASHAGDAHERAGLVARAHAARARARRLVAESPGAESPALRLDAGPPALTRREREIAGLAARGLTSQQIAEMLTLSKRTVDVHLGNVYAKLGISSRRDLAATLGLGPDDL